MLGQVQNAEQTNECCQLSISAGLYTLDGSFAYAGQGCHLALSDTHVDPSLGHSPSHFGDDNSRPVMLLDLHDIFIVATCGELSHKEYYKSSYMANKGKVVNRGNDGEGACR